MLMINYGKVRFFLEARDLGAVTAFRTFKRRLRIPMSGPSLHKRAFALILTAVLASAPVLAQDNQQQVPYTQEEYNAYQNAVNTEPAKREDAILQFIKAKPESALVQYAVTSYLQLLQEYQNQGQPQKVLSGAEKLLTVQPNEENATSFAAVSAFQLQQFQKAVQYGEKVYAAKPSAGMAFILANSYGQLKNNDKYIQYGERACTEIAPKDCFQVLGDLTRIFAERENWNKAAEYARKALQGFEAAEKPAQTPQAEWNTYVTRQRTVAYAVLGRQAAERENWNVAVPNYQRVLSANVSPALNAEAHFYIGRAQWKQHRHENAMESFAKGSVQRSAPHARPCRQSLEQLYRATHNDSLAGIEDFINQHTR